MENKIIGLFLKNHRLRFNEIEKSLNLRSNLVDYHIKALVNKGILKKEGLFYKLSSDYEHKLNFIDINANKLSVVLIAIVNKNKIYLTKREKRPYKDYYSLLGKRMKIHEGIEETALNCCNEEKIKSKFNSLLGVVHERLTENNKTKHGFVFFIAKMDFVKGKGLGKWFDLDKIKQYKEIIPSDIWMIDEFINKNKRGVGEIVMEEKENKIISIKTKWK